MDGLWKHDSIHINFFPVMDDLGVKYMGKNNVKHLLLALCSLYIVTEDWGGVPLQRIDVEMELYGLTCKHVYAKLYPICVAQFISPYPS